MFVAARGSVSIWAHECECVRACACVCLFGLVGIDANWMPSLSMLCLCYAVHIQYRVISIAMVFSACFNVSSLLNAHWICLPSWCLPFPYVCFIPHTIFSRMINRQRSNNNKMKPKSRIKSKRIVRIVSTFCLSKRKFSLILWPTRDQNHRPKWKRWDARKRLRMQPEIRLVIRPQSK